MSSPPPNRRWEGPPLPPQPDDLAAYAADGALLVAELDSRRNRMIIGSTLLLLGAVVIAEFNGMQFTLPGSGPLGLSFSLVLLLAYAASLYFLCWLTEYLRSSYISQTLEGLPFAAMHLPLPQIAAGPLPLRLHWAVMRVIDENFHLHLAPAQGDGPEAHEIRLRRLGARQAINGYYRQCFARRRAPLPPLACLLDWIMLCLPALALAACLLVSRQYPELSNPPGSISDILRPLILGWGLIAWIVLGLARSKAMVKCLQHYYEAHSRV